LSLASVTDISVTETNRLDDERGGEVLREDPLALRRYFCPELTADYHTAGDVGDVENLAIF
jgi:hypothetical protein